MRKWGPFGIVAVLALWTLFQYETVSQTHFEKKPIYYDILYYYSFLPAALVEGDLSFEFIERNIQYYGQFYWPNRTPEGAYVNKATLGVAYFYAPFFVLADAYVRVAGLPRDPFSDPYQWAILLSGFTFGLWGLYLLYLLLCRFYSRGIAGWVLIAIGLGTNLLYYITRESPMSHAYSFFLVSAACYVWLGRTKPWSRRDALLLGAMAGALVLIRPTNALLFVIPVGMEVHKRLRGGTLSSKTLAPLAWALLAAIVVWLPQLIYWKWATGQWIYYSYNEESFFFSDPKVMEFLFSYRKGWLVYSPLFVLAVVGFCIPWRHFSRLKWPIVVALMAFVYVMSSWWCWWFGGSLGSRVMVEWYPLLAIPLAELFSWAARRPLPLVGMATAVAYCLAYNQQCMEQYSKGILNYHAMTKASWLEIQRHTIHGGRHAELLEEPNYAEAIQGREREAEHLFSDLLPK
jgi:hypothetical protein